MGAFPSLDLALTPFLLTASSANSSGKMSKPKKTRAQRAPAVPTSSPTTIAKQARDLLAGRDSWQPSWQQIPSNERVLRDVALPPALPEKKQQQFGQQRLGASANNVVRLRKVKAPQPQVLPPTTTAALEVRI